MFKESIIFDGTENFCRTESSILCITSTPPIINDSVRRADPPGGYRARFRVGNVLKHTCSLKPFRMPVRYGRNLKMH